MIIAPQPAMTERSHRAPDQTGDSIWPGNPCPHTPLVSVVIPCYNQAHFLGDAIDSVLAQDYAPLEIVVVNDGSTDDTAAVAGRYTSVRQVRQENRGLAEARNTGLAHSRGELLVFLDADDRLLPGALRIGAALLAERTEAGFAAGQSRFINRDGVPLLTGQPHRGSSDGYLELLRRNSIRNPAMVMFRRVVLDRVGGFDARVPACADYEMYLRISRDHPVAFHTAVVAEYRKHGANMSADAALMLRQLQWVMRKQRPYLTSASRREAHRDGVRNIKTYYGDRLATQIRTGVRTASGWRRTASDITTLVRCHPRGAAAHMIRKLGIFSRVSQRRLRSEPERAAAADRLAKGGAVPIRHNQ